MNAYIAMHGPPYTPQRSWRWYKPQPLGERQGQKDPLALSLQGIHESKIMIMLASGAVENVAVLSIDKYRDQSFMLLWERSFVLYSYMCV